MPKLRLAFFKAKHGCFDDKLIDWWTGGGGYSHCELIIDTRTTIGSHISAGGVSMFYYDNILRNDKWDIYELDSMDDIAIAFIKSKLGQKYDLLGLILTFIIPIKKQDRKKWWCSEILMASINRQLGKSYQTNISPNGIIKLLNKKEKTFKKRNIKKKQYKGDLYGRSNDKRFF
jgi:hypothetical protein